MSKRRRYLAYFDGAIRGKNPGGDAAIGWVLADTTGLSVLKGSKKLGTSSVVTNNVAEYTAAIDLLETLVIEGYDGEDITVHGDSKLVIEQVNGNWQCHAPHLKSLLDRIQDVKKAFSGELTFKWVPREGNTVADGLANEAYDE